MLGPRVIEIGEGGACVNFLDALRQSVNMLGGQLKRSKGFGLFELLVIRPAVHGVRSHPFFHLAPSHRRKQVYVSRVGAVFGCLVTDEQAFPVVPFVGEAPNVVRFVDVLVAVAVADAVFLQ